MKEAYEDGDMNPFEVLPFELLLLLFDYTTVKDLGLLSQVNHFFHTLAESDECWRHRCKAFSPLAIDYVQAVNNPTTWKATYRLLVEATTNTHQRLLQYYSDHARDKAINYTSSDPVLATMFYKLNELDDIDPDKESEAGLFSAAQELQNWQFYDLFDKESISSIKASPLQAAKNFFDEKYALTLSYCQLIAAAATGHTTLVHHLLNDQEPSLTVIFNTNFKNYSLLRREQHPISSFPIPYALADLEIKEPGLIQFARFYQQQDLLDRYFQIVLKTIPETDRLFWAVVCLQSEKTLLDLLESGQDVNQKVLVSANFTPSFTALHAAVLFNDLPTVKLLLERGAILNDLDHYAQVLYSALINRQQAMLFELMDHHSNPIKWSKEQLIAMMEGEVEKIEVSERARRITWNMALRNNCPATIKALLEREPGLKMLLLTEKNFYFAFLHQHTAMFDLIVELILQEPKTLVQFLPLMIKHALYFHDDSPLLKALDAGIDLTAFNKQKIRLWIDDAELKSNLDASLRLLKLLLCEIKIQRALTRISHPYRISSLFLTFTPKDALVNASHLDRTYFTRRINLLYQHPSYKWDKRVINTLDAVLETLQNEGSETLGFDTSTKARSL